MDQVDRSDEPRCTRLGFMGGQQVVGQGTDGQDAGVIRDIPVQGKSIVQKDRLMGLDAGEPGALSDGRVGCGPAGGGGQKTGDSGRGACQQVAVKEFPSPQPHPDDALMPQFSGVRGLPLLARPMIPWRRALPPRSA